MYGNAVSAATDFYGIAVFRATSARDLYLQHLNGVLDRLCLAAYAEPVRKGLEARQRVGVIFRLSWTLQPVAGPSRRGASAVGSRLENPAR